VVREEERGYGAACLAGLRALDSLFPPPRIVAFIDGDRSDDPSRLAELVAPIVEGRADMVLGVRRTSGGGLGTVLPHARLGNRVVLALARLMFGRRFRDLPPFRAVDAQRLGDLCMDDRNWGWTLQMQLRAVRHGLRIVELEMPHRRRTEGRSKISGSLTTSLRVGLVMLGTLLREWRRPLPSPPET